MRASRQAAAVVAAGLAAATVLAACSPADEAGTTSPAVERGTQAAAYRAFAADSWWNTPLPRRAPTSALERQYLRYLRTAPDAGGGCLRLAGTAANRWGQPVFWATAGDQEYDVRVTSARRPRQLARLRIPASARPADTSDAAMTVFDRGRGYVTALTGARYDPATDSWSARGGTVTFLRSNGLHHRTGRSDDPRNQGGHRGNNGATMMVRHAEVTAGAIRHVLKVASGPETSARHVFPMVGSDGDSTHRYAPPQGLRLRIRPSVDIDALRLGKQATVIAKALQRYGMYLGDSAGVTTLKLEDTRASGRGQLWRLRSTALCKLPFTPRFWDVVRPGYDPTR
jgi:hypothetical protein